MNKIRVYVEIEQKSNIKYEFNKNLNKLVIDRILDEPFIYPYAYGYIPKTLADDNDELDILIISDSSIKNDSFYDVFIIGALVMEDEKGMDEKVLCVLEEDYEKINDLHHLSEEIKNSIYYFFSNYKKKSSEKWSRVLGYIDKNTACDLYKKSII
jgi:inorganic pyrophosphatase